MPLDYCQDFLTIVNRKLLPLSGFPDTMNPWRFYDFLDGRGNNLIRAWLDSLPVKASAKIDARILFMRSIRIWPEQYVSALVGWPSLFELRIISAG